MKGIKRILIANRGEIARRVARTCRKLGIETVAVFSDFDRHLPHLKEADLSYRIGPALSYLEPELIVNIALESESEAIHPGYGFLSENPALAKLCEKNEIIFIGPESSTLELFGDKDQTRHLAIKNKVPVPQGLKIIKKTSLDKIIGEVGLPLMIKAVHGGGGKGMRLVREESELGQAIESAQREAEKAFSSGELIAERAILNARHIEVQVLGDGKTFSHLYDRDCSLQRRHQKIIEIAPAEGLSEDLREKLFQDAVALAKAASLRGVATVEFLVDSNNEDYFLLEVNPRIQVEHPVTELVCGIDLVEKQIEIASGKKLKIDSKLTRPSSVAIELRLCAENPVGDLLPQTGLISQCFLPESSKQLRIDHNICDSLRIGGSYDSMLCKLIGHGKTRIEACSVLKKALEQTVISGIQTNKPLLESLLRIYEDKDALPHTKFLEENFDSIKPEPPLSSGEVTALAWALRQLKVAASGSNSKSSFLTGTERSLSLSSCFGNDKHFAKVSSSHGLSYQLEIDSNRPVLVELAEDPSEKDYKGPALVDGKKIQVSSKVVGINGLNIDLDIDGFRYVVSPTPVGKTGDRAAQMEIASPLPGSIIEVRVKTGEQVKEGQILLLLESMKMEHPVVANSDSKIGSVKVKTGETVEMGATLVELEKPD